MRNHKTSFNDVQCFTDTTEAAVATKRADTLDQWGVPNTSPCAGQDAISHSKASTIKNSALALLARREHSLQELKVKLSRKYSDTHEIDKQLNLLVESDLQSEKRFVEAYVRLKKTQGKGPNYIKQELKRRGISDFLVAAYIYEKDDDWFELARTVYLKKFGDKPILDNKEKAKRIRFMVSRGFTPDSVFPVLDSSV